MILHFVRPPYSVDNDIAIVGSSGCLKNKSLGKKIDSHKEVVRFNRAPTKGFETDVGTKTTSRVVNNHVFANVSIWDGETPKDDMWEHQDKNFVKKLKNQRILWMSSGHTYETLIYENSTMNHSDKSNDIFIVESDGFEKLKLLAGSDSGLAVGTAFVLLCVINGLKPTLYGFDMNMEDRSRTHYWENRPEASSAHSIDKEKTLLKKMLNDDMIIDGELQCQISE